MQIVIKIDEDEYNIAKYGQYGNINVDIVRKALANGTPLPKGHGRLIDADALPLDAINDANYGSNYIRIAPTIIEADEFHGKHCPVQPTVPPMPKGEKK